MGELMIRRLCPSFSRRTRAAVSVLALGSLLGCSASPPPADPVERMGVLRNNLSVAAAALAAGQPEVARRQYLALAERFRDSPEPFLGLGHVAFGSGDHARAERLFVKAAKLARDAPSLRAEALLGAGRTALTQGRAGPARGYLAKAQEVGRNLSLAPWIANAVAVAAAMEGDHGAAEASLREAVRLSSGHPVIAANLVRMLAAAGRRSDAARLFAQHPPSYWPDDDARELARLIGRSAGSSRGPSPGARRRVGPDAAGFGLLRASDARGRRRVAAGVGSCVAACHPQSGRRAGPGARRPTRAGAGHRVAGRTGGEPGRERAAGSQGRRRIGAGRLPDGRRRPALVAQGALHHRQQHRTHRRHRGRSRRMGGGPKRAGGAGPPASSFGAGRGTLAEKGGGPAHGQRRVLDRRGHVRRAGAACGPARHRIAAQEHLPGQRYTGHRRAAGEPGSADRGSPAARSPRISVSTGRYSGRGAAIRWRSRSGGTWRPMTGPYPWRLSTVRVPPACSSAARPGASASGA